MSEETDSLRAALVIEQDHSLSMETLVGSLRTQLALSHEWANRADQERVRLYDKLVALKDQRDAMKKAVRRIALSCPATQGAELLDAAEETAATSTARPDGIRGRCCDCDEAVRKE